MQGCSESDERNYVYRVLYDLVYVDLIEVVLVYAGAKFRRLVFRKKNVGKIPDRPFVAARLEKTDSVNRRILLFVRPDIGL